MKLGDQVSSLAPSQRLKELGVKQESHFQWIECMVGPAWVWHLHETGGSNWHGHKDTGVAAFTVAELGDRLPSRLYNAQDKEHGEHQLICEKWPNGLWNCAYVCMKCKGNLLRFQEASEADARAKMLIYLLENKLITL